ncbi:hypothetical protein [Halobaculum rubrum]|uniref:hypothetical protein n=1 Tax=Halobaculum rubrum TaxID=2872158 RepID=UPI001CA3F97F|nr:hypothetical protein [Halobaculum rubrum]QZX99539.1 hypothetical protein K6T25_00015 [Halobaculum rubrum]
MSDEDANADELPDALREDDPDWQLAPDSEEEFVADAEAREFLRAIAENVRGDSGESKQLSAILYRVSDLYDPDEDTSPEEIYLNVRRIMQIKERGGLKRE